MRSNLPLVLLLNLLFTPFLFAQQAKFEGFLYNYNDQPEGRIGVQVLPAETVTTKPNGYFKIFFPPETAPGKPVNIVVGKPGWVVFYPAFGETTTQDRGTYHRIDKIYIAPRGSIYLLGPRAMGIAIKDLQSKLSQSGKDIKKLRFQNRSLGEINSRLSTENTELTQELAEAAQREQEAAEISKYLDKYAAVNGFTKNQVLEAVQSWAKPDPADTPEARAEKYLWNHNYKEARSVAEQGASDSIETWKKTDKIQTELILSIIRQFQIAATASERENNFRDALEQYKKLFAFFSENKIQESNFAKELADARLQAAHYKTSIRTLQPAEAVSLLKEALGDYRGLLKYFAEKKFMESWAKAQIGIGRTLLSLASMVPRSEGDGYTREAKSAFEEIVKLGKTDEDFRRSTGFNVSMGLALANLGILDRREGGAALKEAAVWYERELKESAETTDRFREIWARVTLGHIYHDLGNTGPDRNIQSLKEAETVFRDLMVFLRVNSMSMNCGCVETDLANVLLDMASADPSKRLNYLVEAEGLYRYSLSWESPEKDPERWAYTMSGLGQILHWIGDIGLVDKLKYFKDSASSYRAALSVPSRPGDMRSVIRTQYKLSAVLIDLGDFRGPDQIKYLKEAEDMLRKALSSIDAADETQDQVVVQNRLNQVLASLGEFSPDPATGDPYFREAETSYRAMLPKWSVKENYHNWIDIRIGLGNLLIAASAFRGADPEKNGVREAEGIFREVLSNCTPEKNHDDWFLAKRRLSATLRIIVNFRDDDGADDVGLLKEQESIYREILALKVVKGDLDLWVSTRMSFGSVLEELAGRDSGAEALRYYSEAEAIYREVLGVVNDEMDLASENWKFEGTRDHWLWINSDLCRVLYNVGNNESGEKKVSYLRQAMGTCREILIERSLKPGLSQVIASKDILADVLRDLAEMSTVEDEKLSYYREAESLYADVLKRVTPKSDLRVWSFARTEHGQVLQILGNFTNEEGQVEYLKKAESDFREVIAATSPQNSRWAWQNSVIGLGEVLGSFAARYPKEAGPRLKEAEIHFDNALKHITYSDNPERWTRVMLRQGRLYQDLADNGVPEAEIETYYRKAETLYDRFFETVKSDSESGWIDAKIEAGRVYDILGSLQKSTRLSYLKKAEAAWRAVLGSNGQIEPSERRRVEINLARTLRDLGRFVESDAEARVYCKQAESTFQELIKTADRESNLQEWLVLKADLGNVLQVLGDFRDSPPDEKNGYLRQAETVYAETLAAIPEGQYTNDRLWLQKALAKTYSSLKDIPAALKLLIAVHEQYPEDEEGYQLLAFLYHEDLYDYAAAFALHEDWLRRYPDYSASRFDMAENLFTLDRLEESETRINTILTDTSLKADEKIVLKALLIAIYMSRGQKKPAHGLLQEILNILSGQPLDFRLTWNYGGTKQFVSQNKKFAISGPVLLKLFNALEITERARQRQILRALQKEI